MERLLALTPPNGATEFIATLKSDEEIINAGYEKITPVNNISDFFKGIVNGSVVKHWLINTQTVLFSYQAFDKLSDGLAAPIGSIYKEEYGNKGYFSYFTDSSYKKIGGF